MTDLFDAVSTVVEENPEDFAEAVDGVERAKKYLLGLVLQKTDGKADPDEVTVVIEEFIEEAGPNTFVFPYRDAYSFSEKVAEVGIPDTSDSEDTFYYMPEVALEMEKNGSTAEASGVEIDGTMYDIEERET